LQFQNETIKTSFFQNTEQGVGVVVGVGQFLGMKAEFVILYLHSLPCAFEGAAEVEIKLS
jgi:hypothetical protein